MKKYQKLLCCLLTLVIAFTQSFLSVKATTQQYVEIIDYEVNIRTGPSTSYSKLIIDELVVTAKKGDCFQYVETIKENDNYSWFHILYIYNNNSYDGYIRNDLASLKQYQPTDDYDFYQEIYNFPESYRSWLLQLHYQHPNWKFYAYNTGISFQEMLDGQNVKGRSTISGSNTAYRSKADGCYNAATNTYIALDGNNWYQAAEEVIAYYVDPRNFLNEKDIYMFLKLKFSDNETVEDVQKLLDSTFMAGTSDYENMTYAQMFYQAGKAADISPIYLATLAIQEMGRTTNVCTTGQEFTYNGKTYSGLYNFFNIGAYAGTDNWKHGLIYANGGENGTSKTYSRPWNNQYKAIYGGALWIGDGYINDGQDTMYFQKFNSYSCVFYHQYMTNVQAAVSQSYFLYTAYSENGGTDLPLTFTIPVYSDMPTTTALPGGSPKVAPDISLEEDNNMNFVKECNLYIESGTLSGFSINTTAKELITKINNVNSNLTITISNDTNQLADDDLLKTGQQMTITNGDDFTRTYTLIIKGDCNCDGVITPADYVTIKNHITGRNLLNDNIRFIASDYNRDGNITPADYVGIKKYILSR